MSFFSRFTNPWTKSSDSSGSRPAQKKEEKTLAANEDSDDRKLSWSESSSSSNYSDDGRVLHAPPPPSELTLHTMLHYSEEAKKFMKRHRTAFIALGVVSGLAIGIGITIATMGVGPVVAGAIVAGMMIKSGLVIGGTIASTAIARHWVYDTIAAGAVIGVAGGGCILKGCFFEDKTPKEPQIAPKVPMRHHPPTKEHKSPKWSLGGNQTASQQEPLVIPESLPGHVYGGY